MTRVVLLANQNTGYHISNYLRKRNDAEICKIVVYKKSENQWWKSVQELVRRYSLPVYTFSTNVKLYEELKKNDFDLLLSIGWRHKVTDSILRLPRLGAVNFHNSLLPNYRGAYANAWALIQGEKETGVTLHWMISSLDTGDIIYQQSVPIYPWDTARTLWLRQHKAYLAMFRKIWPQVHSWRSISKPQKGRGSFYTVADFEKTNAIDLNKKVTGQEFINFLRGKTFDPYYKNTYFIDPKTKKKIYVSITLRSEA